MPMLTTATTLALISTFKESIVSTCKDIKSDIAFFLDNGMVDYINSIQSKFQNTKTFLYRQENVYFYDVFFPVSIRMKAANKIVTSCEDLFSESNFVSIIGSAGSGKTMLMKHFFLESIKTYYKIPLFIELRALNDSKGNFSDLVNEVVLNNRLSPDKRILERLLETGQFILLLDGYDEIFSDKKDSVTNDIDKFIDRYSKNRYIISSRPGSGLDSMPRFNNYPVMPLNKGEIDMFIDIVLSGNEDSEIAPKIKSVISSKENKDYSNFLSSPLLLSMFILTFKQYPELPKKKSKFYWNVFDTLATKHDSFTKKGGYQHERKSGLENDEFEKVLQWFSYISLFSGKITFDEEYLKTTLTKIKKQLSMKFDVSLIIDDLTVALSILLIDGIEYRFPHKSLQEYFSACLIRELPKESKIKIYQQQLTNLEFKSNGGSGNLWSLVSEIDLHDFNEYFIIHNLKLFLSVFTADDKIGKVKQFYDKWNLREGFEPVSNSIIEFKKGYIHSFELSFYRQLITFLDLETIPITGMIALAYRRKKYEFLNYFVPLIDDPRNWEPNFDEEEESEEDSGGYFFAAKPLWGKELETILEICNIDKDFSSFLENIASRIKIIEKNLKEEKKANINLLEL